MPYYTTWPLVIPYIDKLMGNFQNQGFPDVRPQCTEPTRLPSMRTAISDQEQGVLRNWNKKERRGTVNRTIWQKTNLNVRQPAVKLIGPTLQPTQSVQHHQVV